MSTGKLKLRNGSIVDSVCAISTTISLAKLFKEEPAILFFFALHCRTGNPQLDDKAIDVSFLHEVGLCDAEGVIKEDVLNVTICTVQGETIDGIDLVTPSAG